MSTIELETIDRITNLVPRAEDGRQAVGVDLCAGRKCEGTLPLGRSKALRLYNRLEAAIRQCWPEALTGDGARPPLAIDRIYLGPTIRGTTPRGTVRRNTSRSRWKCPHCASERVQISVPVWFREYQDGELVAVSVDEEADPIRWYCEHCDETGEHEPARAPSEGSDPMFPEFGVQWSRDDAAAADAEGWNVCPADECGLAIEHNDINDVEGARDFETDDEAIAWVTERARAGSALHTRALAIHEKYLRAEEQDEAEDAS